MSSCLEEDDGYDSVGEDAELELSCALHDLALRVKSFEENMRDRFHTVNGGDDDEIAEDIPEADGERSAASPKRSARRNASTTQRHSRQRTGGAKASKQQPDDDDDDIYNDDDEEDGGYDSDDEDSAEDETKSDEKVREEDWDFQEQKEELSEMQHNIALLLQGMKAEAKALESRELELDATDDNQ